MKEGKREGRDSMRIFYETMYQQIALSERAQFWRKKIVPRSLMKALMRPILSGFEKNPFISQYPFQFLLKAFQVHFVVGLLQDEVDPMVSVMKVEKAPLESYADIGGLDAQIQEIKEAVELPLTHIGIKPPNGVILYGEPGTCKTLLAKAVANFTSATFLRVVGNELIQKYLGDGLKLVRELFKVVDDLSPSIVFIDEILYINFFVYFVSGNFCIFFVYFVSR
ncbi:hypothetical protein REPUB_Repub07fG0131300 [Reevesia pubescens]